MTYAHAPLQENARFSPLVKQMYRIKAKNCVKEKIKNNDVQSTRMHHHHYSIRRQENQTCYSSTESRFVYPKVMERNFPLSFFKADSIPSIQFYHQKRGFPVFKVKIRPSTPELKFRSPIPSSFSLAGRST